MKDLQQQIGAFFGISNDKLEEVAALFIEEDLNKGDYFVKEGQHCEKLSFVQEGYIRLFANDGRKEITQWIACKGYFLTELNSFMFKQTSRFNMQALSNCKLYTIHKENYRTLNTIVANWPSIEKQFIASCFITLEDRVFNHLSLTAEERYDQLFAFNKELFNHVPLNYIASMLGMSPETFSRIRKKKVIKCKS